VEECVEEMLRDYKREVERLRELYRPKGLLAFTTAAKEYVKLL